jgi:hypothetical protein
MTAALLLVGGLTLAGCGQAGTAKSTAAGNAAAAPYQNGPADAAKSGSGASGSSGTSGSGATAGGPAKVAPSAPTVQTGRSLIYTGEIQLRVDHGVDAAVARAEQLVTAAGGYVDSELAGTDGVVPGMQYNTQQSGGGSAPTQPLAAPSEIGGDSAQLVLRIPADSYDTVYRQLMGLGTVLAHQRSAQDVTQQVVDLSSRVKTQQASVARVRALMDRAQSIADVTALEADLTQREADLESLEAQLQALQSQTAMSTVTVQLYTRATPAPVAQSKQKGVGAAALSALRAGWHALYLTFRALLIALAALLPFLVLLGGLGLLLRRYLGRRRPSPTQPQLRRTGRPWDGEPRGDEDPEDAQDPEGDE